MSDVMLSDDERRRFAGFCRRVVAHAEAMERQIGEMRLPTAVMERMQQRERNIAAAYGFVLADLELVETVTIRAPASPEGQP